MNKSTAPQKKPRNLREEQLDKFIVRLNQARAVAKLPPLTYSRLAAMLWKVPTEDLHAFYVQCDRARSFSAMFHWALKPKKA